MITQYVAGFLFDEDFQNVALIKKEKPAWQKGKLNAIGGKIEPNETPLEAMKREFLEETGMSVEGWYEYVTLSGDGFVVHFFYAITEKFAVRTMTEEEIQIHDVDALSWSPEKVIPNLHWLIPMAITFLNGTENVAAFDIFELSHKD